MYSNALLPSSLNLIKLSSTETTLVKAAQDLSMLLNPKVHLSLHFTCFQQHHLTQWSRPPPWYPFLHLAFRTLYSDFPPTLLTTPPQLFDYGGPKGPVLFPLSLSGFILWWTLQSQNFSTIYVLAFSIFIFPPQISFSHSLNSDSYRK